MNTLYIALETLPDELRAGIELLKSDYPIVAESTNTARTVHFTKSDAATINVSTSNGVTMVSYREKAHAFRAIGKLLGISVSASEPIAFTETPSVDFIGLMLDCSRNAVHTPDNVRRWLRRLALMGNNAVCLYTEDTYEVPEEPLFGYGRGAYTEAELRSLDDYGDDLGIEMFPCIQTLGHLEQVLQWKQYEEITDIKGILLADDPKTYEFLERIITAAMKPFRSKRVHLGMDEAHGLGDGRYKEIYGERRRFDIMVSHLNKVLDITRGMDLKPMMWSDMWFRIGSKVDDYYDLEADIPDDVIEMIPKDVTQVYWDYYHNDVDFYRTFIDMHRKLGSEPLVAPGATTWNHFWAYIPRANAATDACMIACKEKGVKETLMTMWGDDGAECEFASGLAVMARFCEHAYADSVEDDAVREIFHGITGSDLDAWHDAAGLDAVSILEWPTEDSPNPAKWLLWEDPLFGLWQPQLEGRSLATEYSALADRLAGPAEGNGMLDHHLRFPAQVARVLGVKADLPSRLRTAYEERDLATLKAISDSIPALMDEIRKLREIHRESWFRDHKPQGWEVLEARYGALIARCETAIWRLENYLNGEIASLPELEEKRVRLYEIPAGYLPGMGHARAKTASNNK
jgi:hexosaminidase